jgi:hypothetical protein
VLIIYRFLWKLPPPKVTLEQLRKLPDGTRIQFKTGPDDLGKVSSGWLEDVSNAGMVKITTDNDDMVGMVKFTDMRDIKILCVPPNNNIPSGGGKHKTRRSRKSKKPRKTHKKSKRIRH